MNLSTVNSNMQIEWRYFGVGSIWFNWLNVSEIYVARPLTTFTAHTHMYIYIRKTNRREKTSKLDAFSFILEEEREEEVGKQRERLFKQSADELLAGSRLAMAERITFVSDYPLASNTMKCTSCQHSNRAYFSKTKQNIWPSLVVSHSRKMNVASVLVISIEYCLRTWYELWFQYETLSSYQLFQSWQ